VEEEEEEEDITKVTKPLSYSIIPHKQTDRQHTRTSLFHFPPGSSVRLLSIRIERLWLLCITNGQDPYACYEYKKKKKKKKKEKEKNQRSYLTCSLFNLEGEKKMTFYSHPHPYLTHPVHLHTTINTKRESEGKVQVQVQPGVV